jgi:hypothetical protein
MPSTTRSTFRRLLFPMSGLIALASFVHACGGGGGGGGGGNPPAPNPGPGTTTFRSTSQFPTDNSTNVPLQPIILVGGFTDTVNPVTVTPANVTLTQGGAPVPATPTYLPCSNQIQLLPDAALSSNLLYTVNLTAGVQDDDAESLTPLSFEFTTRASTDTVRPTFNGTVSAAPNPGSETTEVMLSWVDASDGANAPGTISYRVYMTFQTAPCFNFSSPILTTGPGALQVVVPGLIPRTGYSFVVRAVDAAGNESLGADQGDATTNTSFLTNVYPIVSQFCISCHNPPNGQAWLNNPQITMDYSTPATVHASWFNVTPSQPGAAGAGMLRVDPGNPANSFLYNKINSATPVAGSQMPLGQPPLSGGNQAIIFDWISEGALDN